MADDDFDVDEKVNEKMFDSVSIKFSTRSRLSLLTRSMLRARQNCTQEVIAAPELSQVEKPNPECLPPYLSRDKAQEI